MGNANVISTVLRHLFARESFGYCYFSGDVDKSRQRSPFVKDLLCKILVFAKVVNPCVNVTSLLNHVS